MARRLKEYYGVDSFSQVEEELGIDTWAEFSESLSFPEFDRRINGVLDGDSPHAGGGFIMHDRDTFEDAWGVVRRRGSDGKLEEWITGPLAEAKSVDEYNFPGPERIIGDPEGPVKVAGMKEDGWFVNGGLTMPFKLAWELRGLQNFLMDYHINPQFLDGLYDKIFALETEQARRLAMAGVDCISVVGDIAMQDRLIMSPGKWRHFDKPRLSRLIAEVRQLKPDIFFFIHSDGNLMEIMSDLIEIGFDIINPVQPECMDPVRVKECFGSKITLHGTIGIQTTLPFGTVDEVRREVAGRIENCGYNGGLILGPANVVMYDTPIENVIALYETARDYDLSSLAEMTDDRRL